MTHPLSPCRSCPYRDDDALLGKWHRDHYQSVLDAEASPFGAVFACHCHGSRPPGERGLCAGFAIDQRERGFPSIMMRIQMTDAAVAAAVKAMRADGPMHKDASTMARLNLRVIDAMEDARVRRRRR